MIREKLIDDFFSDQPNKKFIDDLKIYKDVKFETRSSFDTANFVGLREVYLEKGDFKTEKYLKTVFDDFDNFLQFNNIFGNIYCVELIKNNTFEKEEFEIKIGENKCEIFATERESIRRALIFLEDMICTSSGNIEKGVIHKKAFIERRISRCFFSPINRAPRHVYLLCI